MAWISFQGNWLMHLMQKNLLSSPAIRFLRKDTKSKLPFKGWIEIKELEWKKSKDTKPFLPWLAVQNKNAMDKLAFTRSLGQTTAYTAEATLKACFITQVF
jgi:hypothetical protein